MNSDYNTLMNDYKGSQAYNFIVNHLNQNYKNWTAVNEIGGWAPELVLFIIHFCVDDNDINNLNTEIEKSISENITDEYPKFKQGFKEVFHEQSFFDLQTQKYDEESMGIAFLDKMYFGESRHERDFNPYEF